MVRVPRLRRLPRPLILFLILPLLLGAVGTALLASPARPAAASHYRSTQLTWTKIGASSVRFHLTVSHRRTFHGTPGPNLGDKITLSIFTGENSFSTLDIQLTVVAVDDPNDWILLEGTGDYTYPGVGPYTAYLMDCCRLNSADGHVNNPSSGEQIATLVNLAATSASPVSAVSPIVDCPKNGRCAFTIPSADADGQEVRFRFATSEEATGHPTTIEVFTQPGPPKAPNAATIDPATGLYAWDTTGATLAPPGKDTYYSTQIILDNLSRGAVVSTTAVEFFIRIADDSTNKPPTFTCPTPQDGTTIAIGVGKPVAFDLAATDPDNGNVVRIGLLGKPADATFTATAGNPANASFSWTPTQIGTTLLTLTAQDQRGLGATQRSVTIVATPDGPAQANHKLTLGVELDGAPAGTPGEYDVRDGECAQVRAQVVDEVVFTGWKVDGQPVGHANPLSVPMAQDRVVVAQYATPPNFCDVQSGDLYYEAIRQLAARKIIRGFENASGQRCFGPDDSTLRAQLAALIARPLGWDLDERGNTFTDRCLNGNPNNCIDDALWRNVGTLQAEGVVGGYKRETCVALGLTPPCYGPHDEVLHAQVISFITRGMVEKGYWQYQPDNAALYPNVPADSGHRVDIATWVHYVGGPLPGTGGTGQPWAVYARSADRSWFAEALWRALDSYFGLDRVP